MINRKFFFDHIRAPLFGGRLAQRQADGMEFILDVWEADHPKDDPRNLAYALATTFHETDKTMQPIHEKGGVAYLTKMYDPTSSDPNRAALARRNGNTRPGDGPRYAGRGFVQLTWGNNYRTVGDLLNLPLYDQPNLALDPTNAARIMFIGMERGIFTGKAFTDYFTPKGTDWKGARRIINGVDHADGIASYAKTFYAAISYLVA